MLRVAAKTRRLTKQFEALWPYRAADAQQWLWLGANNMRGRATSGDVLVVAVATLDAYNRQRDIGAALREVALAAGGGSMRAVDGRRPIKTWLTADALAEIAHATLADAYPVEYEAWEPESD